MAKLFKRVSFGKPKVADVIIFNAINAQKVSQVIPQGISKVIFRTNPVEINISYKIFLNFIINLKYFNYKSLFGSKRGALYQILWQLQMIYIKADLDWREPKALITYIDNCKKFAWLSENFGPPCIAIQNGFRLAYDANPENDYYCNHLFCFGNQQIDKFPEIGYKVDNFYPVGSLNLSKHFDKDLISIEPVFDFLVVSCWRGNIGFGQDVADSMKAMRIMDELFAQYLSRRNYSAAVILRSERNSDQWLMPEIGMTEEDYYKSIYGDTLEIIDTNFVEANVYPLMQTSDVIIASFATTCLVEALSMGKKVLYANFCETKKYHIDFSSEIVFDGEISDAGSFEARLDVLKNMSELEYQSKNKKLIGYYVARPENLSTYEEIKSGILNILADG